MRCHQLILQETLIYAPNAPSFVNADGSLNWANNKLPSNDNPYSSLKRIYKAQTNNLIANLILSYQLFAGLELRK